MNLIVVDIQPMYYNWFPNPQSNFLNKLSQAIDTASKVFWYFNGSDLGCDSDMCVMDMICDYIKGSHFNKIEFIEKSYGFLRDWMDRGDDEYEIVETIKLLRRCELNSSAELYDYEHDDPIWIPDIKIPEIDFAHICGGCDQQCLAEMELLLKAFGVRTKRLPGIIF